SDRFSKRKVTSVALFAQVVGLAILCLGMGLELFSLSLLGFFMLAVQSAMLSPAKKGILKELVGSEKLGMAVGWMEMLTMVGILTGAYAGAKGFDALAETEGGWRAGFFVSGVVGILAIFSWIIFRPTPEVAPRSQKPFRVSVLFSHFQDLAYLWKEKPLRLAALGDAWFWAFGTFFYLVLVKLAGEVVPGNVGMASLYGLWFLLLGAGIMAGSLLTAYVNRGRVDLGLVPVGAILMPVILFALTRLDPLTASFRYCCVGLGAAGAFFFVPLNAFLQDRAGDDRRGRVVAASNLLTNLLVMALIGVHAYLSNTLELDAKQEFLVMVVPSALLAVYVTAILPEAFFRTVATLVSRILYRVKVSGSENMPREGGALLLCNHVSYADPVLIGANATRDIQFIAFVGLADSPLMRLAFRLSSTIPISPTRAKEAIQTAARRLNDGDIICIFPEGGISRIGPLLGFKKGFELIARRGGVPVVPAYMDGLWGSIFSYSGGKVFRKWPSKLPYPLRLRMGTPIPPKETSTERVRQAMQRLSREAFADRKELKHSLHEALENALKRKPDQPFVRLGDQTRWTRAQFLELARNTSPRELTGSTATDESGEGITQLAACALDGGEIHADGTAWPHLELMANVFRLMETSLWDAPSFRIRLDGRLDSSWDQTWRLWAPALGGLVVTDQDDGFLQLSHFGAMHEECVELLTGLSVPELGVVALNLPNPPEDTNPDDQAGSADGSLGRILPGLEACFHAPDSTEPVELNEIGELQVVGVTGKWRSADCLV
ncbi:MAG: MFS transporter, partial [Opitutales bacterium]